MSRRLKFMYEAPDHAKTDCSEPDHTEPNHDLHRQIAMYKQQWEQNRTESYTNTIFFFWKFRLSPFFNVALTFPKPDPLPFSIKESPKLLDPLYLAILSHCGTIQTVTYDMHLRTDVVRG
jgi:hypothetical protein